MNIDFQCDQCGKHYAAGDNLAGKKLKCKVCGKVLRIPGTPPPKAESPAAPAAASPTKTSRPAGSAAKSSSSPKSSTSSAPKPPPLPPAAPEVDIYGLDEEPTPAMKAAADAADYEEEAAPVLQRAGAPPKPKTKAQKKKFEERVKKADRSRLSFSQPMFGVSFGAVLMTTLFIARWYFRIARITRGFNDSSVEAEYEPGKPRPPRQVGPITLPTFPDAGPGAAYGQGVVFHEIRLGPPNPAPKSPGHRGKLWLYLPAGQHAEKSLPCVLIAGAGSNLITGMELSEEDRPEHLPYVHAGFAVLAYELDGDESALEEDENSDESNPDLAASEAFLAAQAGLVNAHNALEYVLAKVPQVDPNRIYAAGHSSAGTLALLFAENEPRLKACVAYAPRVDTSQSAPPEAQKELAKMVPGSGDFFTKYNPKLHWIDMKCPLFLFHAIGDPVVPAGESIQLADDMKKAGRNVTIDTVPGTDHQQPMMAIGIPHAIDWLKKLPAE